MYGFGGTIVIVCGRFSTTVSTNASTATVSFCPCCGHLLGNHVINIINDFPIAFDRREEAYWSTGRDALNEAIAAFKSDPIRSRLSWRDRTIHRWRPYRRPISYLRFLRPQTQAPRPKCRDPPVS
jgi:hypothetical protein